METETVDQAYERLKPLPGAGVNYLIGHGDGWNDYHNWQKARQSKEVAPVEERKGDWIEIDVDSENVPASFQNCWLCDIDGKVDMGYLIKYGDDYADAEWEYRDKQGEYEFDHITHYIVINAPEPPININK